MLPSNATIYSDLKNNTQKSDKTSIPKVISINDSALYFGNTVTFRESKFSTPWLLKDNALSLWNFGEKVVEYSLPDGEILDFSCSYFESSSSIIHKAINVLRKDNVFCIIDFIKFGDGDDSQLSYVTIDGKLHFMMVAM